ncbi:MAG: polysaccharide deacetylase family protein [Chloroflexi bacterium]|nr:polysaccharide deacetylase family protein [Chloroflexota bacterium]
MDNPFFEYSPIVRRQPLRWPNSARVAVWVLVAIEYFEFDRSESGRVPDVRNYSRRDYGPRVGVWRLMDILDKHQVKGSVVLNSAAAAHYPVLIEEIVKRGWDIIAHGISNYRQLSGLSIQEERQVIRESLDTITSATGKRPRGWLGPGLHETFNTLELLAEAGIEFVGDWVNDDQPYLMNTKAGTLVSLPYSVDVNDRPMFLAPTMPASALFETVRDAFDVLYEEGRATGRVLPIAVHPYLTGQPSRAGHFDQALSYVKQHPHVWWATASEIVDWYKSP